MNMSELRLQCLSLVLLVVLVPRLLFEARPLNPSMQVEGRKKQYSLSSSTVEALVKEQYFASKGETPGPKGSPVLYATPPYLGNHEMHMSAGQMVHGGENVTLKRAPVPPSDANPTIP